MRLRWLFLCALVSAGLAFGAWRYTEMAAAQWVHITRIVVPAMDIAPYTPITAAMLTTRELPTLLVNERIYVEVNEVQGLITTMPLKVGQLIYPHQAVSRAQFRFVEDDQLEVMSLALQPEQALGGQLMSGQVINVYQLMTVLSRTLTLSDTARAELLVDHALVIAAHTSVTATIVTVAVLPDVARRLIVAQGERRNGAELWVTLAPLSISESEK